MAAEALKKSSSRVIDTWKQKKWYKVLAPAYFGSQLLGETVAMEDDAVVGRTVTTSLMNVTGDVKKQNVIATFEVMKVNAGNGETRLKKLEIAPPSVRRMIRKGKDRVDVSLVCATKDNVIFRIKPFHVTRGKTGN
jgi:small subunit ribosomal protein S3Ae